MQALPWQVYFATCACGTGKKGAYLTKAPPVCKFLFKRKPAPVSHGSLALPQQPLMAYVKYMYCPHFREGRTGSHHHHGAVAMLGQEHSSDSQPLSILLSAPTTMLISPALHTSPPSLTLATDTKLHPWYLKPHLGSTAIDETPTKSCRSLNSLSA